MPPANEITSADGGWRVLFAFIAQWPAATEFCRYAPAAAAFDATLLDAAKSTLR
jgi:hypothetical protein